MAKRKCYFQCIYDGPLYGFPAPSFKNYEKFCKWKSVLRKIDQEKDNVFIRHTIKLCGSHFEKHFIAANNRLTRHAVPTLNIGLDPKQEYLLCSFIEKNAKLIMHNNLKDDMLELLRALWKILTPKLNKLGPMKSYNGWVEYLDDVMANLKTKEVIWTKEDDMLLLKNCDDFTELELKILQIWKGTESGHLESNLTDENDTDMEFVLEDDEDENIIENNIDNNLDGNIDNNIDGNIDGNIDCNIDGNIDCNTDTRNDIITYSLYVETGGLTPLLQAADIAPRYNRKVTCKCKHSDGLFQDKFEFFGKVIAQELRNMPTECALETQSELMSIIRSKQKIIHDSFL